MARLTVEDCLDKIPNRYDLVILASKRARQVALGKEPLVDAEKDKSTVIALREIAEGLVTIANVDKVSQTEAEEEFSEADFQLPTA